MQTVVIENVSVVEIDGNFYVSSLQVAEHFEKQHKDVLRAIENLEVSAQFRERNFTLSNYRSLQGKKMPMYLMTRDGFVFLCMGFTGPKAAEWKERYIDAFNGMEKELTRIGGPTWLQKRFDGIMVRKPLTDTIQRFVQYAIDQGSQSYAKSPQFAYSNFTKMEYKALFMLSGKVEGIRDHLSGMDLSTLAIAERAVTKSLAEFMDQGLHYKEIYQKCKERIEQLAIMIGVSDQRKLLEEKNKNPFSIEEV